MAETDMVETEPDACEVRMVDPERVASASERLPAPGDIGELSELFKLLGEPTRLRIACALVDAGELCVCDIAAVVGAPETSVSHALRLLRMAGVVRARRHGRMAYYAIEDRLTRLVLDLAVGHVRNGEDR